jgi:hypothetical protein
MKGTLVNAFNSPLHAILDEVNRAAENGMPILAIIMASTLPDICVSLAAEDGKRNDKLYKEWCKDNLGPAFSFITGDDLFSLRCAGVHNGKFVDLKHNVRSFAFVVNANGYIMNNKVRGTYLCSAVDFCRHITEAVHGWLLKNVNNEVVQKNMVNVVQARDLQGFGINFPFPAYLLA